MTEKICGNCRTYMEEGRYCPNCGCSVEQMSRTIWRLTPSKLKKARIFIEKGRKSRACPVCGQANRKQGRGLYFDCTACGQRYRYKTARYDVWSGRGL